MRIFQLADVVEVHLRQHGVEAAIEMASARRGRQFDPTLVDAFCAAAHKLVAAHAGADFWSLLASTPGLARPLNNVDLDSALEILADFTDLRSAFRTGH